MRWDSTTMAGALAGIAFAGALVVALTEKAEEPDNVMKTPDTKPEDKDSQGGNRAA